MDNRQDYMKEYNKAYKQTYKGFIKYVYAHQIRNCKTRNHSLPEYTEKELLKWYTTNPAHLELHQNWIRAGCDKNLTPSIDRLDNAKTYSFDNIEVVTWLENQVRARQDTQNGVLPNSGLLNGGHTPVVQYDLDGNKIASYISLSEAERLTGIDHRKMSEVCKNLKGTYKGFFWAYLEDEKKLTAKFTKEFLAKTKKQVKAGQGYKVAITYTDNSTSIVSVKEASNIIGTSTHNTKQLARGVVSSRSPQLPTNILTIELKD